MNGISRSSLSKNQMSFSQGDRVVSASHFFNKRFSSRNINMPDMAKNPLLDMDTRETIVRPLSFLSGESSSGSESEPRLGNREGDSSSDSEPENCRNDIKREYVPPDCSAEILQLYMLSERASSIKFKEAKYQDKYQGEIKTNKRKIEKMDELQGKKAKLYQGFLKHFSQSVVLVDLKR